MLSTKMIGEKITEARKKMDISQAQLAERLFISPQAVGKWERGESMPDITTLNRLAEILGVDLNYFSGNFKSAEKITSPAPINGETIEAPTGKAGRKPNWDMSRGNWADADFSGLKDLNDKFSSSNMLRCKFTGSNLSGILLKGNNIASCDFSDSDISNSRIQGSHLSKNLFTNCSLQETEFSGSHISGCDFTNSDLTEAAVKSGGFEKNTLTGATWKNSSFADSYIADLVFDGVIEDCSFENCSFKRVTFRDAILSNTFFKNRSLKNITFINCQADRMTYEFLKNGKANLNGITLMML